MTVLMGNETLLDNATMTMTSSPTFAPNSTTTFPCSLESIGADCNTAAAGFDLNKEALWMVMWIVALLVFLCLPFCSTQSRRDLCWRRIKERRWIYDDTDDDWYAAAIRRQQEQRRQQMEEEQKRFQTSRTQEDEIREQFLLQCMENYTMVRQRGNDGRRN
jgi:hypothetical protein